MSEYFFLNKVAAAHYGITLSKHSEWKINRHFFFLRKCTKELFSQFCKMDNFLKCSPFHNPAIERKRDNKRYRQ